MREGFVGASGGSASGFGTFRAEFGTFWAEFGPRDAEFGRVPVGRGRWGLNRRAKACLGASRPWPAREDVRAVASRSLPMGMPRRSE